MRKPTWDAATGPSDIAQPLAFALFILLASGLWPLHIISDSPQDLRDIIEQRASGHSNRSWDAGLGELFPLTGYRFDVGQNKFAKLHENPPRSAVRSLPISQSRSARMVRFFMRVVWIL